MTKAEENYPIHEKEMLVIIYALKVWRVYLEGQKFSVKTDHKSLTYWQSQPVMSRRQARWSELLAEYDFDIEYQPGKTNVVADAMTRLNLISNVSLAEDLVQSIKQHIKEDQLTDTMFQAAQDGEIPEEYQGRFELQDGLLFYKKEGQ